MVAYLSKSDASEGFTQIIDFFNRSYIKYALTLNDITRLQALVDKKKVVVTKATIREALLLDDAEGRKFNFSKYIFDSLVRNINRPTKFYMYPHFLQLMIRKQVGDLSTHTTKYTSPALTQKVFANIRRVGKGFSRVETPLFESMLVEQQVAEEGDADENDESVNAGDASEGDVNAAHGEVPLLMKNNPFHLLHHLLHHHNHLKISIQLPTYNKHYHNHLRRVEHLEFDKVAQALEITKLKRKMQKLERRNKDDAVVMKDDKEEDKEVVDSVKDVKEAKVDESAQDQRNQAESQAEIYKIDMDHANKVLSMQKDKTEAAKVQEVVDVVTTAKLITEVITAASETVTASIATAPSRRRKGVVIMDPEEESTTSTIIPAKTKSKDKGKGILAELNKNIDWDEAIDHVKRKAKEDPAGMSYDDIRPIFEAKFNSYGAFLLKTKEQIEEDENKALKRLNETPAERAAKRQKLDEEVEELKIHLKIVPNKDDDVYTEATPLARKALWSLVKERFSTTKPKNFSDDFLLVTLGAMFEKPDIYAQIWKTQRNVHGLAKLILLVERKYPLTRFTLDQMLNAVRLEVKEESEVSLELLRFTRQQHQEGQLE
nr:hypothetical protein [Tanacetum cinerariifolium]